MLTLLFSLRNCFRARATLQAEILALRHQLLVLQRSNYGHKLPLGWADRVLWVWLSRLWNDWRSTLLIVKPETVIAWHRKGWRLVKDLDGCGLDRKIREAGWTFFCLAGQLGAMVSGIDEQKTLSRAVEQILASPESAEFNSLEIMRVASEASKRFLGVCYVTVSAQSRHIQDSAFLFQAKVLLVRDRARSAAA